MKDRVDLEPLLAGVPGGPERRHVFAFLALGVVDAVAKSTLDVTDVVRVFFHAANCMYVRKRLRDEAADEVMSRGVQLPDLVDALPRAAARQEVQRELKAMTALCSQMLESLRVAA